MRGKIQELIRAEKKRQEETLMMIPSENYTYPEVMKVVGSPLMHKYAENLPGKRYYQGMQYVDELEEYVQSLAMKVFRLSGKNWGVNVQPYSGTPANLAVYNAILNPGDKIMAMYLPDGGHLSHGWEYKGKKITMTSKIYNIDFYHVDKESLVFDYEKIANQAKKFKPKLIISGGTAYPREINHKKMGEISKSIGAFYLADIAHEAGLVAGGANKSPFKFADFVTMTTHKTLRGPRGALAFARNEHLDKLNSSIFPGLQGGPHMHTIAGIGIALEKALEPKFKKYAEQVIVNAKVLADELKNLGFEVVSGETDKHLVLIDLSHKKLNGWFAAWALEYAGIIANRNTVPYDTGSPYYPSGLRIGTPALTARGMKKKEMIKIANWINSVIEHIGEKNIPSNSKKRGEHLKKFKQEMADDIYLKKLAREVKELCKKYPVYK